MFFFHCLKCRSRKIIKINRNVLSHFMSRKLSTIRITGRQRHFISPLRSLNRHTCSVFSQNSSFRYNSTSAPTTWLHSAYFDSKPVLFIQDLLLQVHDATGLPWWSTVVISVVSLRLLTTFPLAIYQQYILAKYENLSPEITTITQQLLVEVARISQKHKFDEATARRIFVANLKKQRNLLIVRDNCHPFKGSILLFVQFPLWVSFSLALRNLLQMLPHHSQAAQVVFLQMSVGGTLWFSNLTHPDGTLLIPVILGLVNLTLVEFHATRVRGTPTKGSRIITILLRGFCVVMVPVAAMMPSCLPLYWLTSSIFGLVQNMVIFQPKVRRFFRIPKSPSESETPLGDFAHQIKQRLRIVKK